MFINPFPFTSGAVEKASDSVSVSITVSDMQGYQGNPFVKTEETTLKRELYDLQKMLDPGDPSKERQIWHMFPGVYYFTSDVYVNVPNGYVAYLVPTQQMIVTGCSIVTRLLKPGYKGLIDGQFVVNGGEVFLQPGQDIAELVMVKAGEE